MADSQDSTAQEIWKAIPGFPGYDVSSRGRVRSYWRRATQRGWQIGNTPTKFLKPSIQKRDYRGVNLTKDGKKIPRRIHLLVLLAFVGPMPPGMESRHLDGVPSNCSLENLCYGTHIENMMDRKKHGFHQQNIPKGPNHHNSKMTEAKVILMRMLAIKNKHTKRSISALSKIFGISTSTGNSIVNRKTWTHVP
jgi:hypothetical protein